MPKSKKPRKPRSTAAAAAPATPAQGPQFRTKPWQSGKAHLTPAQLAGKMRKVH